MVARGWVGVGITLTWFHPVGMKISKIVCVVAPFCEHTRKHWVAHFFYVNDM